MLIFRGVFPVTNSMKEGVGEENGGRGRGRSSLGKKKGGQGGGPKGMERVKISNKATHYN